MRVGRHEVFWHRPVIAFPGEVPGASLAPTVLAGPLGYLTAYDADKPDLASPVELWPRLLDRAAHAAAVELFAHERRPHPSATTSNARALLEYRELLGPGPLPRALARALVVTRHKETLEGWLESLPEKASDPGAGQALAEEVEGLLAPADQAPPVGDSLT